MSYLSSKNQPSLGEDLKDSLKLNEKNIGRDLFLLNRELEHQQLEIPEKYVQLLKSTEFFVPDEIMDMYADSIIPENERFRGGGVSPMGTHINFNFLSQGNNLGNFLDTMVAKGIPSEKAAYYAHLFFIRGHIILSKKTSDIGINQFSETLQHERVHREIKHLTTSEVSILKKAAKSLLKLKGGDGLWLVRGIKGTGHITMSAHMNWEEVYCYIADSRMHPQVRSKLQEQFPEAYEIFTHIEKNTETEIPQN